MLLASVLSYHMLVAENRFNIVILLADDLGWKDGGCYADPVKTPIVDHLAGQGILFSDFHSGAAVCSPSPPTHLTGHKRSEQVLKPSTEIRKESQTQMFLTDEGRVNAGLAIKLRAGNFHVLLNPLKPEGIKTVEKSNIEEQQKSPLSTMPNGLLETFQKNEILDLLAYLQSDKGRE